MNPILIVDDNAEFRSTVVELLQRAGYPTLAAGSGREALEIMERTKLDIVLLDLVLPGMDGLETLREMRRLHEPVKVILISAFATIESAVAGIKLGAADFYSKPFHNTEFIILIQRMQEEIKFEQTANEMNLEPLLSCLANPIRKKIVERLRDSPGMRLTDLMREMAITDHTKLAFHILNLIENDIINKESNKTFILTPRGRSLLRGLRRLSHYLEYAHP